MKKFWPFSFYLLNYAAFSSLLPFFVIFYQGLGFSGTQIGLLTGVPPLISLVCGPLGTGIADSTRRHKLIMGIGLLVAVLMAVALPMMAGFAVVFATIIVYNIFISPVGSLADSATITMLGDERDSYGRIRLGGTIGWGVFAPIAGALVQRFGLNIGFWLFAGFMFLNLIVSQQFDFGKHEEHSSAKGSIKDLLGNRRWVFFLVNAFLGGIGTMSVASFLYPYMAEFGSTETQMGIAALLATVTELPIFFFGNRLVKKFGAYGLFMISLILMGVRSLLLAAVGTPALVYLVQIIGGTIFPAMWLAGVSYADANAPKGLKATAQGLFGAMTFGFGSAVGGFIGGLMLESLGGRKMFMVLGILILGGLLVIEGVKRLIPEKVVQESVA